MTEDQIEHGRIRNFLYHCTMGLAAVQHNGNMVIKLYDLHDVETVSIIFALYNLF